MTDVRLGSMVAERHGSGPAVVMVHGLGGSSGSFETLIPALDGFCVLRPDLPGAGRSAPRPGRPGLAGLAAAVRECMRAAGVGRAHLVGHSMGALLCQHIAAAAPGAAASLTLYGALLEPAPATREALADRAREARATGMAGIADAVARGSLAPAAAGGAAAAFVRESVLRQSPAGYAAHCEALAGAHAAPHAAIRCPTLLVHGAEDPVAPPAAARSLCERIEGARLETLRGVGHWPMLEAPARAADLLCEHLAQASARAQAPVPAPEPISSRASTF